MQRSFCKCSAMERSVMKIECYAKERFANIVLAERLNAYVVVCRGVLCSGVLYSGQCAVCSLQ